MVNCGPLAAEIVSLVWGTPAKFQRVSRLGSVTARHFSSRRQPNFAALNRGRRLYAAGRPSRWAFAHSLVVYKEQKTIVLFRTNGRKQWTNHYIITLHFCDC